MPKDKRLERAGVDGYNKPKRTPNHPTKSHVVVAKDGDQVKPSDLANRASQEALKKKASLSLIAIVGNPLKPAMPAISLKAKCQPPIGPTKLNGR